MIMINNEIFTEARSKLENPSTQQEGIDILKKILDIKQAHLWRSEVIAPCCGNLGGFACQLSEETDLLEKTLLLIEKGNVADASPLLDRLAVLIRNGMGQRETDELINGLTASPKQASD